MISQIVKSAALAALITVSGVAANAQTIQGAGATFPAPLYQRWAQEFGKESNVRINYQAIGSGGGIKNITARAVDFGASDGPMSAAEIAAAPGILHIPMVAGAVAIAYNAPGVPTGIKLTGAVLGDIYTGKVTTWNDAAITSLNPGVNFPALRIIPCFRADSSGTTAITTNYLAKVSPAFQSRVGEGKAVRWPVGFGGKGNDGVAALLRQNRGAIGYVEVAYANKNKLSYASIKNAKGNFVSPSLESATAAAEGSKLPSDFRAFITNSTASQGYPITGFTWILVYQDTKPEVKKFLTWALTTGQKSASALEYAPLPESVRERALKAVNGLQ